MSSAEPAEPPANLAERSITAVLWGAFGTALKAMIQIACQVILARLLGPEQYGLFAAALAIFLFSSFFADVGLSYGLIQKKEVSTEDIRFVFTWQTILGLSVTTALLLIAPWVGEYFNDPRLVHVLRLLSIACAINSLRATASALLHRKLDFKTLNLASLASYTCGFVLVGVPLALSGAKVEALVAAFVVEALVGLIILYGRTRHPIRPLLWSPDSDGMLRFGFVVLITNMLNWVMSSIDRMVIGRMFNMTQVGLYSTAYNLITMPALQAQGVLQTALYSASSRVQDDLSRLRSGFRTMFGMVALFFVPMFVGISVVSDTVILAIYGIRWIESAPVLAALSLAMPFYLMMGMAIPALWASGNTTLEFKLQVPLAIFWVLALIWAGNAGSIVIVSSVVSALFVLRALIIIMAAIRVVKLPYRACLKPLCIGIVASAVTAVVILGVDREVRGLVQIPVVWLLADALAGAVALVVAVRVVHSWIDEGVLTLIRRIMDRMPNKLGARMYRLVTGEAAR